MAITYILKSDKDGSYYVGATRKIEERLLKHGKGEVSSTKSRRPFKLVYYENFNSFSEANEREMQIKRWKKRRAIEI